MFELTSGIWLQHAQHSGCCQSAQHADTQHASVCVLFGGSHEAVIDDMMMIDEITSSFKLLFSYFSLVSMWG